MIKNNVPFENAGGGIPFLSSLINNGITDLNEAITQGQYVVSEREEGYQNLPPDWVDSKGNGYLLVFCSGYFGNGGDFIAVQLFCGYNGTMYAREHWYKKWHGWVKFSS